MNPWWQDPGFVAVLVLTAVVVVGFVIGAARNRRLLADYLARLRGPLLKYADPASARRLGTSGYHIIVPKAKRPFRKIDVFIFAQPREFVFYWVANRVRGRGDRLYVHVTLQRAPRWEVHAGPEAQRPREPGGTPWEAYDVSPWPGPLYSTEEPNDKLREYLDEIARLVPRLYQVRIQRKAPHISLLLPLDDHLTPQTFGRLLDLLGRVP